MSSVLILGAGVAGLTAGIYCLKKGHTVTICEQHTIVGGNLTGWTRERLHIDNCIHWLTGTNKHSSFNKIWKDIGAISENIPMITEKSLYTFKKDDKSVSLYRNLDETIREMESVAPEDIKEIKKLKSAIELIERLNHTGGENFDKGMNLAACLKLTSLVRFHNKSTREYGQTYYKSPVMQGFFEGLLGPDFSALSFVMVAANYCSGNGDIPEGGSLSMAMRIQKKFKELGGIIKTQKKASKVNIENGVATSVEFEDGEKIEADNIVVSFDPKIFFEKLTNFKPTSIKQLYNKYKRFSTIHTAFAIPEDAVSFSGMMSIEIPEKYRELLHSDTVAFRESSYEKSFVRKGKKVLQAMIYVDEEYSKHMVYIGKNDKEAYKAEKEELGRLQKSLMEEAFPDLQGKLELLDNWTPYTYARYVGSEIGSWMSFVLPARKLPTFLKSKVKNIKNVFLASQWNMMPGGLPFAALAGKNVAKFIK